MRKLLVVSHDAGGAELISSYLKYNRKEFDYFLKGPALQIFKKKFKKNFKNLNNLFLEKKIKKTNLVLTGTSWESGLEKKAIFLCKKNKVKVSSFVDHWVNYTQRFKLNNKKILPDEIWSHDKYSQKIALKKFDIPIRLKKNYYFKEVLDDYKKIINRKKSFFFDFIFLSEPIKKHFPRLSYSEYTCFLKFIKLLKRKKIKYNNILIRLHPSEKKNKYSKFLKQKEFNEIRSKIEISENKNLIEDLKISRNIIGINSMALVIAVLLKKKVFSCLNTNSSSFKLPYSEIKTITSISNEKKTKNY